MNHTLIRNKTLISLQLVCIEHDVIEKGNTVKLVMFACSKYCVFFIFSFMRVLINATPPDVRYLKQKGQIYACFNYCVLMHSH